MKKILSAGIVFFFASFLASAFSEKDIISPARGQWCNQQVLVLDSSSALELYYSFSGTDPFVSGFAYDGPVLIEKKGDVCVRIGAVDFDGNKKEFEIDYRIVPYENSVASQECRTFAEKNFDSSQIISYTGGTEYVLPKEFSYSFDNGRKPFLDGPITLDSKNCLDRYVPFIVSDGINSWHSVIHVLPSVKKSNVAVKVPFEIRDWNTFAFTDRNYIYQLDDGMWSNDSKEIEIDRKKTHVVKFQSVDYKAGNAIYGFTIPVKPSYSKVVRKDGSIEFKIKSDENYCFENGEKSIVVDVFKGEEISSVFEPAVYFDGNFQGRGKFKFSIDRLAPENPVILSSDKNPLSRSSVVLNIKSSSEDDVFYSISEPLYFEGIYEDVDFSKIKKGSKYRKYAGNDIVIRSSPDKATVYKVSAYAKDKAGNRSDVVEHRVILDELNYYLSSTASNSKKADGSFVNPFSSFEQALEVINSSDKETRLHVNGTFILDKDFYSINKDCKIKGINCRLVLGENSVIEISDAKVSIESCYIEKQNKKANEIVSVLKAKNSVLRLKDCEISASAYESCILIETLDSRLSALDCGFTVKSEGGALGISAKNGMLEAKGCRFTSVGDSSVNVKACGCECRIADSSMTVIGGICRGGDFTGCRVSLDGVSVSAKSELKLKASVPFGRDESTVYTKFSKVTSKGF